MDGRDFFPEVKWLGHKVNHALPSSAGVQNEPAMLSYVFIAYIGMTAPLLLSLNYKTALWAMCNLM
jgi:hypothetical protein